MLKPAGLVAIVRAGQQSCEMNGKRPHMPLCNQGALRALFFGLTLFSASSAPAGIPRDAIGAIAVSPDGATVVATGNPRTFYVLDAATLTVKDRVWHGYSPLRLSWSKDGKTLAMLHTDDVVTFFDAETLKETTSTEKFAAHCFASEAGKLFIASQGSKKDDRYPITLSVYSLATGEKLSSTALSYTVAVSALACSPDASEIVLASTQYDTKAEEKKDAPKDMAPEAKAEFRKRNDAKAMWIGWFDGELAKGPEYESWFSNSAPPLFFVRDGKASWFANGSDNAEFAPDGTIAMKALANSGSFYGEMLSTDHATFLSGTLGKGYIVDTATLTETKFDFTDRLKGWPEYLYGFAIAPDGTIFGGTSAYRMLRIAPDGKVLEMKPIH
jgi:hypothetical protein